MISPSLFHLLESLSETKYVVLDVESNGLDVRWHPGFEFRGIAIAGRDSRREIQAGYYGLSHQGDVNVSDSELSEIRKFLSSDRHFIAHNVRFDWQAIHRGLGVDLWNSEYFDTMLMAHWINENDLSKELDYLGRKYVGRGKESSDLQDRVIQDFGWAFVPFKIMEPYAIADAVLTLELFEKLHPLFIREGFDE